MKKTLIVLAITAPVPQAAPLTIVEKEEGRAVIVVQAVQPKTLRAGQELQTYVEKISGLRLPLVLEGKAVSVDAPIRPRLAPGHSLVFLEQNAVPAGSTQLQNELVIVHSGEGGEAGPLDQKCVTRCLLILRVVGIVLPHDHACDQRDRRVCVVLRRAVISEHFVDWQCLNRVSYRQLTTRVVPVLCEAVLHPCAYAADGDHQLKLDQRKISSVFPVHRSPPEQR